MDPLYVFAFLQAFVDILREYFGQISAETLKDNFDTVYQVRAAEAVVLCDLTSPSSYWKKRWMQADIPLPHTPMLSVTSSSLLRSSRKCYQWLE